MFDRGLTDRGLTDRGLTDRGLTHYRDCYFPQPRLGTVGITKRARTAVVAWHAFGGVDRYRADSRA